MSLRITTPNTTENTSMNYAGFTIKDMNADEIRGSSAFNYRGYVVSMSTIFTPPGVAIMRHDDPSFFMDVATVEEAINVINSLE